MAANSQWQSKNALGNFYRRIKARSGPGVAIVATARKIATIWYMMQTKREAFNPEALNKYQKSYMDKRIKRLENQLAKLRAAS